MLMMLALGRCIHRKVVADADGIGLGPRHSISLVLEGGGAADADDAGFVLWHSQSLLLERCG